MKKKKKIINSKKYKNLNVYVKMEKTIKKFGDIEIKKQKFQQHKRLISINNIDIIKIVISNKVSFSKKGFKYFTKMLRN